MGMVDRIADAGLRGEMYDCRKAVLREQRLHGLAIGEVGLDKLKPLLSEQDLETRLLQRRVVIGVEIVEAHDRMTLRYQLAGDKKADKSRRARYQYGLIRHCIPRASVSQPPPV